MDPVDENSQHICPISKEAGLPPRRSIDCATPAQQLSVCDRQAVWHPSTQWGETAQKAVHLSPVQQQQLASACLCRDVKLLQTLLPACNPYLSEPLDSEGNTALHLCTLPYSGQQAAAQAAACTVPASRGRANSRSSWFSGCFGSAAGPGLSCSRAATLRTLSSTAAAAAQHSMVSALLAAGADTNVRNQHGRTPLMLTVHQLIAACSSDNHNNSLVVATLRTFELLCKHVLTDPNMKDAQGRTALVLLLQGQQQQQVKSACGSSCHKTLQSSAAHTAAAAGGPHPVLSAAQLKGVQLLLHSGADCNAADHAGMTPLMFAAAQLHVSRELLQLLLERGANTRQLDNARRSALTHALLAHNLRLLPSVGYSSNGAQQQKQSCSCSSTRKPGAAPAAVSAAGGRCHLPEALIKAAPGVAAGTASAGAPASSSSNNSTEDCDSCASPDLHAQVSSCPCGSSGSLHRSSTSSSSLPLNPRHGMVIKALCSYGALDLHPASINTRFPGLNGFSQLHIAMRRGDVVALQMLLSGGADVNAVDVYGNSALMYWPVSPSEPEELVEELVGKLLSHGADPNLPNHDGWHALDLACELNKLGKVVVKPQHVPVHALLVGWGATNSSAFKEQHRNPPQLLCMRTDSANSFIRNSKGFGSIRVISTQELEHQVAALREDTSC